MKNDLDIKDLTYDKLINLDLETVHESFIDKLIDLKFVKSVEKLGKSKENELIHCSCVTLNDDRGDFSIMVYYLPTIPINKEVLNQIVDEMNKKL